MFYSYRIYCCKPIKGQYTG